MTETEIRSAVDLSQERKIGKHTNHWIQNLYCKDCRQKLTDDEIFNMGYNWATSELKPIKDLANSVLSCSGMVERKEIEKDIGHMESCVCQVCSHGRIHNDCHSQFTPIVAKLKMEIEELRKCHETELGVCFQHCDEVNELKQQLKEKDEAIAKKLGMVAELIYPILYDYGKQIYYNRYEEGIRGLSKKVFQAIHTLFTERK